MNQLDEIAHQSVGTDDDHFPWFLSRRKIATGSTLHQPCAAAASHSLVDASARDKDASGRDMVC